jgi:AraC-like DNA-binding protein
LTYNVTAKRWKHGWELHIDGVGVTQSRTLDTAEQMVRDYIETLTDKDVTGDTVVIVPELGALDRKVRTVREQLAAADRQQQEARNSYRVLAADLRAAGLSVSDTAAILGVSRGRVSQLTKRPAGQSFADWIREIRGPDAAVIIYGGA